MLTLEKLQVVNCVSHWCPVPRPITRTADNGNSTSKSNTSSTACGGGLTLLSSSATLNTVAFKNNSAYYIRAPDDPPEVEEGEGWGGGIFVSAGQLYTPPGKQVKYYSGTAIKATTVAVNGARMGARLRGPGRPCGGAPVQAEWVAGQRLRARGGGQAAA
jgi:hypothetical protein